MASGLMTLKNKSVVGSTVTIKPETFGTATAQTVLVGKTFTSGPNETKITGEMNWYEDEDYEYPISQDEYSTQLFIPFQHTGTVLAGDKIYFDYSQLPPLRTYGATIYGSNNTNDYNSIIISSAYSQNANLCLFKTTTSETRVRLYKIDKASGESSEELDEMWDVLVANTTKKVLESYFFDFEAYNYELQVFGCPDSKSYAALFVSYFTNN